MAVSAEPACTCSCVDPRGHAAHLVSHALAEGDLDLALTLGLLGFAPCPACSPDCVTRLARVQDERRQALAARERYRQREARLDRRRLEREQRRMAGVGDAGSTTASGTGPVGASAPVRHAPPALPAAAAAALARAQAKAAKP